MSVFGSMKIFTKYSKEQQAKYDIKYTKDRTNMDMKLKLMLETNCSFEGGVGWRGGGGGHPPKLHQLGVITQHRIRRRELINQSGTLPNL